MPINVVLLKVCSIDIKKLLDTGKYLIIGIVFNTDDSMVQVNIGYHFYVDLKVEI